MFSFLDLSLIIGLGGLCLLGLIAIGIWYFRVSREIAKARRTFDEIQSLIRDFLVPFGFIEKTGPHGKYSFQGIKYSRGELSVTLSMGGREQSYELYVSGKNEIFDGQRKTAYNPLLGYPYNEADKFRRESIVKLNNWLVYQGVK